MASSSASSSRPRKYDNAEILYQRAVSLDGETVLDPLVAEIAFLVKWQRLPLQLRPCTLFETAAHHDLPVGMGMVSDEEVLRRDRLLAEISPPAQDSDQSFMALVSHRIGRVVASLLWGQSFAFKEYAKPAVIRAVPAFAGHVLLWCERRRQLMRFESFDDEQSTLLDLARALEVLQCRLGDGPTFGANGSICRLDARVFGYLSVLYSIPCESGSKLHNALTKHVALAHFLDRIELQFGAWPGDECSFLRALGPGERLPLVAGPAKRWQSIRKREAWWQYWGWGASKKSWNSSPQRRNGPRSTQPPVWQTIGFAVLAIGSVALQVLLGHSPIQVRMLGNRSSDGDNQEESSEGSQVQPPAPSS